MNKASKIQAKQSVQLKVVQGEKDEKAQGNQG